MLGWLFKRRQRRIVPLFPVIERMRAKDAALFAEIGPLPIKRGVEVWRQKYPEDFADGLFISKSVKL